MDNTAVLEAVQRLGDRLAALEAIVNSLSGYGTSGTAADKALTAVGQLKAMVEASDMARRQDIAELRTAVVAKASVESVKRDLHQMSEILVDVAAEGDVSTEKELRQEFTTAIDGAARVLQRSADAAEASAAAGIRHSIAILNQYSATLGA